MEKLTVTSPWISRMYWIAAAVLFALLPVSCSLTTGASSEFSPQTLQCRYRREVWVGWGMFPIYYSGPTYFDHPLLSYLRDKQYVAPSGTSSPRWVGVSSWNHAWRDGYNRNFSRCETVIAWSEDDSERAQFFWSECFRLLRSESPVEQRAGQMLLAQPVIYRDRAEIQLMIGDCLEYAAEKVSK